MTWKSINSAPQNQVLLIGGWSASQAAEFTNAKWNNNWVDAATGMPVTFTITHYSDVSVIFLSMMLRECLTLP